MEIVTIEILILSSKKLGTFVQFYLNVERLFAVFKKSGCLSSLLPNSMHLLQMVGKKNDSGD